MIDATALKIMNGFNRNGPVSMSVGLIKFGMENHVFVKKVLQDIMEFVNPVHFILKLLVKSVSVKRVIFGMIVNGHVFHLVANGNNGMEINVFAKSDVGDIQVSVSLAPPIQNHSMSNVSAKMAIILLKTIGSALLNAVPINIGMAKLVLAKEIMF